MQRGSAASGIRAFPRPSCPEPPEELNALAVKIVTKLPERGGGFFQSLLCHFQGSFPEQQGPPSEVGEGGIGVFRRVGRGLVDVETQEIEIVREVVAGHYDLLQQLDIRPTFAPVDLQHFLEERAVITKPALILFIS